MTEEHQLTENEQLLWTSFLRVCKERDTLQEQLVEAQTNLAAWEQTHQEGTTYLRQMALREHRQLMQARALLEEVGGWKLIVSRTDLDRYNDLVARVRAFLTATKEPAL